MSYRLHPNRVAMGFRLLARNLAIGLQIAEAQGRPETIREPGTLWVSFRAEHVDGLGSFICVGKVLLLTHLHPGDRETYDLPWTQCTVQLAA